MHPRYRGGAVTTETPQPTHRPRVPHPIPYQGSKRLLASRILAFVAGRRFRRLFEPFAGSAAVTLAAARDGLAGSYILADSLSPLAELWQRVLDAPEPLADTYQRIWQTQLADPAHHYTEIRRVFNADHDPAKLLYLLARCAKNAPRFSRAGAFNQAADRRRLGMRPATMRANIRGAAALLSNRTSIRCLDFEEALADATPDDLVYLDPPYQGTSAGRDRRYHAGIDRDQLIHALIALDQRRVPYLLSYDGRSGDRHYGSPLPNTLNAARLELPAGRSAQATLNGHARLTVESLYVSRFLTD